MTTWDLLDICNKLTEHRRNSDILYTLHQLSIRVSQNDAPLTFDEKSIDEKYLPIVDAILFAEKRRREEDAAERNKAEYDRRRVNIAYTPITQKQKRLAELLASYTPTREIMDELYLDGDHEFDFRADFLEITRFYDVIFRNLHK